MNIDKTLKFNVRLSKFNVIGSDSIISVAARALLGHPPLVRFISQRCKIFSFLSFIDDARNRQSQETFTIFF